MAFASVATDDWVATSGEALIRSIGTSSFGKRSFCGRCGTTLFLRVDHQPETLDFSIVTLDDPDLVRPGFHIFWSSKVGWFDPEDELPRHDKFRPDTRGLSGTEPPDQSSMTGGSGS